MTENEPPPQPAGPIPGTLPAAEIRAPDGPQPPAEIIPGKTEDQARAWYFEHHQLHKDFTEAIHKLIYQLLDEKRVLIVDVIPRVKKVDSFLGKLRRKPDYRSFADCTDMCGCRIICVTAAQIEEVRSLVEEQFAPTEQFWHEPEADKFGYRSYHMMVKLNAARAAHPENLRFAILKCELQIRTAFQEAWSALDHKVAYKPTAATDPQIKRAIQRMAALVELADKEWEEIYNKIWGGAHND
jgi:ppGpp synthetase/RelA/SpoT-type nucleotidyltranferase